MRMFFAILAAGLLLFLSGCTLPWEPSKPSVTEGVVVVPPPSQPGGETIENNTWTNVTENETVFAKKNKTEETPVEEDEFAGIVERDISDRIGDGEFRVHDQPGALLTVYVIKSGNADSILVRKGEFSMLLDAGSAVPVSELLTNLSMSRINVLVATRDAPDAIGGMADVMGNYQVDEFWDNNVPPSEAAAALLDMAEAKGITVKHPEAGESMAVSGLSVDVLNPQQQRLLGSPESDAIIVKLSFNNFCMVLLNPTVQDMEPALLSSGSGIRCDVITYFNHGEGRPVPSLLVENAAPKHVIVSVGPNGENLPSNTTLTRLALRGITVYRTDLDGTVLVSTDGLTSYDIGPAG